MLHYHLQVHRKAPFMNTSCNHPACGSYYPKKYSNFMPVIFYLIKHRQTGKGQFLIINNFTFFLQWVTGVCLGLSAGWQIIKIHRNPDCLIFFHCYLDGGCIIPGLKFFKKCPWAVATLEMHDCGCLLFSGRTLPIQRPMHIFPNFNITGH